jgi:hypothetical protein
MHNRQLLLKILITYGGCSLSEKWVHSILTDLPLMGSSNFKPVLGWFSMTTGFFIINNKVQN